MNGPDAKRPSLSHRMSGADAAFLYLERKEIPLNIASVAVFDSAIPFEDFVEAIDFEAAPGAAIPADSCSAAAQHRPSHLGG